MRARAWTPAVEQVALGIREVAILFGCGRSKAHRIVNRPDCPRPRRMFGAGTPRQWDREELTAWWRSLPVDPGTPRPSLRRVR